MQTASINAVLENYATLIEAFHEMQRCTPDDNGQKAGGVVVKREEITMFIGLRLSHSLFGTIAQTWHQLMMVYHRQFDHILPLGKCRQRKKPFISITALLYRRKEQTEGADTTPPPSPRLQRL